MGPTKYTPRNGNNQPLRDQQRSTAREITDREVASAGREAEPQPYRDDRSLAAKQGGPTGGGLVLHEAYARAQVRASHERRMAEEKHLLNVASHERTATQERVQQNAPQPETQAQRTPVKERLEQDTQQRETTPAIDSSRSDSIER
jgi:hypothetical protein